MANLLIIGGTGFFGKSILDAFQRGLLEPWSINSIDIISRHPSSFKKNYQSLLTDAIKIHELDITSCKYLPEADFVIHAAASTNVQNYLTQSDIEKLNIQAGSYNYCKLARQYHVGSKIVFCSSGAVYGQQASHQNFLLEDTLLTPIDSLIESKRDYAAAKRDAESVFNELARNGLRVAIARCFAFVGFYLPRDQHFAIGNFLEDAMKGRLIKINASHKVYRSYMYADDLVVWLMTIANSGSSSCPIFNVGSDQEIELGQLSRRVVEIIGGAYKDREINHHFIDRYIPSIDKAKNVLGLTPKYDLDSSLIMMRNRLMKYYSQI